MSEAMIKLFVRVIERRLAKGETIEEIFEDYPKLTEDEKEEILRRLGITH